MKRKKVLIITNGDNDLPTDKIIDWITSFGAKCYRINSETLTSYENPLLLDNSRYILLNGNKLPKTFYSIFFWRWDNGNLNQVEDELFHSKTNFKLSRTLIENLSHENSKVLKAFLTCFKFKKQLVNIDNIFLNKIEVLNQAKKIGLKTPNYIITNRLNHLTEFYNKFKKIVVKDLSYPFQYYNRGTFYGTYVELVGERELAKLPFEFGISFFQEYIEKDYEIRVVIIAQRIFSMAIFSQRDELTKVDFRKYNFKRPSRKIPYQLPKKIENRLLNLMKYYKLRFGSIDLIKSINGEYFFLEINPIGQFNMVSEPCNYNIEKIIAEYLVN